MRYIQTCSMQVVERRWSSGSPEQQPLSARGSALQQLQLDKLDLFNFDTAAAWDSPVVLSSPRSLAACRRAGVKPVELLYRSEQEVRASLGPGAPAEAVQIVHRRAEENRQAKLHACRAIRRQMMQQQRDRSSPRQAMNSSDLLKRDRSVAFSRDTLELPERGAVPLFAAKQDLLRASSPGEKEQTLRDEQHVQQRVETRDEHRFEHRDEHRDEHHDEKRNEHRDETPDELHNEHKETRPHCVAISPNLSTATSPARSLGSTPDRPRSRPHPRPRTVLVDCWGQAKSVPVARAPRRRGARPPRPILSATPSSLSESPSRCSSRRSRRRGGRRALPRAPRQSSGRSGSASTLVPSVVVQDCDDSGRGSAGVSPGPGAGSSLRSCEHSLQSLQSLHSLRRARLGAATPSDVGSWIPGSVMGDDVIVPEHDRRILESMAMKKQQERMNEELAHRAHRQWEQEQRQRRQMESERAAKWQESVNERRQWEAKENARRMEAVKRSLRLAQHRLEESIRLKEERVQLRVLEEDVQRMVLQGERSKEYAVRRLEVEEKRLLIQEGERSYRRLLDEELHARQTQADHRRRSARERERLRAASANRDWERASKERKLLLAVQAEEAARVLRATARERHQRANNNKAWLRRRRQQRALQSSLEREEKHSDARAMHADLELGLQLWRERCSALRESAAQRAQQRAQEHREHARVKLQRSNQRRRRHHRALHARVIAEEERRRRAQRVEIRDKDQRIRQLRRLRERELEEAREQAYTTASLREELRRTLSPETFDRKAARVQLEMRVSSVRTSTLSPTPTTRSHIHLG